MLALCEATDCRRTQLLAYFSERTPACGNLRHLPVSPRQTWDGTVPSQKLLSTIMPAGAGADQRYGARPRSSTFSSARRTVKVSQERHHELKTFGIGVELNESQVARRGQANCSHRACWRCGRVPDPEHHRGKR